MKFNKLAAICKSQKRVHIYNDPESGAQWLGDACSMYLLEGMPRIACTDEILRLFDVPESNRYDYFCKHEDLPSGIDFANETGVSGKDLKEESATIGWLGKSYRLFKDGAELYYINEIYLAPFAEDYNYVKFHRREMKGGGFLLGINVGLELQALICPSFLHRQETFVETIGEISKALFYMQGNFIILTGTEDAPVEQTLE